MDKRKYIVYILFLAAFGYSEVLAQLDNSFFYDIYPLGKQYEKNVYFDVEALGYVRNTSTGAWESHVGPRGQITGFYDSKEEAKQ